jgi:hypothetical protein
MESPEYYREIISRRYRWIYNERQPMILHSDIDGILSGMFLHEIRRCYVIGFYDLKCIWLAKNLYLSNKGEILKALYSSLWVDVDIYHENIKSIGHHILKFRKDDKIPEHTLSLNPNILRGIYHGNFERKYPFGTIHFLMMIFNYQLEKNNLKSEILLWHPDSSLANTQHYAQNARDWLENFLGIKVMIKYLQSVDTQDFEQNIKRYVYDELQKLGFRKGRSQIRTRYLRLGGYQFDFKNPNQYITQINNLIRFLSDITGWAEIEIPQAYVSICGKRFTVEYKMVREKYGNFDSFLSHEKVFSYAIPNRNKLNYTIILGIKG